MRNLHEKLMASSPAYAKWHNGPATSLLHWSLFVLIAASATGSLLGTINAGGEDDLLAAASRSKGSSNPADLITPPAGFDQPIPGYVIVKYKSNTTLNQRTKLRQDNHLSVKSVLPDPGLVVAEAIPPGADPKKVAHDIQYGNPTAVEYATEDYPHYILNTTPDDPSFGSQWGLQNIYAPTGWDISTGSPSITVGVVDTGADWNHPELAGKLVPGACLGGFSTTLCTASPTTQDVGGVSHGTHDACNIGANTDNSLGIAGVSWNAKIMPIKVCDGSGSCPGDIDGGILWAVQHGAKVVSVSLGGSVLQQRDIDTIKTAYNDGAVVVVAAGNTGGLAGGFLAGVDAALGGNHLLVVAATDSNNQKSSFSSYGPNVDVAAPGRSILSCKVGGYETLSGTSMATPTVAGLAALVFSVNPKLTNQQVIDLITKNAGAGDGTVTSIGTGVINVARTLAAAKATLGPAGPADTTPPSVPTNLSGSASGGNQVNLSWTASTDNVGVSGYKIIRNGGYVGFASGITYSDKGLSDGTSYTYALIALDAAGNQSATTSSIKVSTPDVTPPTAPKALTATPGAGKITLSWTASSDAIGVTGYRVYRNSQLLTSVSSSTLSYVDAAVTTGPTYTYYVTAYDAAANVSAPSVSVSAALADATPPSAPTNLVASVKPTSVVLTWNAASDNVGVTGYRVTRGGTLLTTVTSTTYTDYAVTAGSTYSYTVTAVDAANNSSAPSNAVSVTMPPPPDTTPPSAPTGLTGSAPDSTKVNLSWGAATDNVGVTGYNVYRNAVWIASTPTLSYTDASVAAGTSYTYTVKAYDAAQNIGAASNSLIVVVPQAQTTPPPPPPPASDVTPPSAPTNLTASVNSSVTQVTLKWSASTDNIGVAGYKIWRGSDFVGTTTIGTGFANVSFVTGTTVTYTVKAFDAAGNISTASNGATVTIPAVVPVNVTVSGVTSDAATISWTTSVPANSIVNYARVSSNGSPGGAFAVQIASDATSVTSHSITLTGLTPNKVYSFTAYSSPGSKITATASPRASFTTP